MLTLAELLDKEPEQSDICIHNGAEYLPIGIVEKYLDEVDSAWSTRDFSYSFAMGAYSGSIQLTINGKDKDGKDVVKTAIGAFTLPVTSTDDNSNYVATLKSYCISNAAKSMGRRFGRHLNGRMQGSEETSIVSVSKNKPIKTPQASEIYKSKINIPNV